MGSLNILMGRLMDGYLQQLELYRQLSVNTALEAEAIRARDMLRIIELLQAENELMEQVRSLDQEQKQVKLLASRELPCQSLSMDQLACTAEPEVSIALKTVLSDIKTILAEIEQRKTSNIAELSQAMRFMQPMQREGR